MKKALSALLSRLRGLQQMNRTDHLLLHWAGLCLAVLVLTVVLTADGKQNLIYKHAISTISPARAVDLAPREPLTPAREIPA